MARKLVGLVVLAALAACSTGISHTAREARAATMLVPEGTAYTIVPVGHSTWRLSYRARNGNAPWPTVLGQRLAARGWTSTDVVAYAPLNRSYSRTTPLGIAELWEWTFFSIDPLRPDVAQIRLRRSIEVSGWRYLWRQLTSGIGAAMRTVPLPHRGRRSEP